MEYSIMVIQELFDDVTGGVETARKQSREAFKAYIDTQKKAFNVVSSSAQALARTEIDAAGDLYAAAKASFDKARKDGGRLVAGKPRAYLPASRDTLVSAYRETLDLLVKTGNELSTVFNQGYRSVRDKLAGKQPAARKIAAKRATAARKTPARKQTDARKTAMAAKSGNGATSR
jgi:hypothetical protein